MSSIIRLFDTSNMIFYIFIIDLQYKSSSNRIRNHVIQSSWINNSNEQILCRIETRTNLLIFVMLSNTHYRPKPLQLNFHVDHPRYAWILVCIAWFLDWLPIYDPSKKNTILIGSIRSFDESIRSLAETIRSFSIFYNPSRIWFFQMQSNIIRSSRRNNNRIS